MEPNQELVLLLAKARVIPILTVDNGDQAVHLARALQRGGLSVLEVVLRTPAALESIWQITTEVPGMTVGAGTVTRVEDFAAVREAGAEFAVSPGFTEAMVEAAAAAKMPFIPGVATASEALAARDLGFSVLKFFPAEACGGRAFLRSIAQPLPELRFIATGGLNAECFRHYLLLANVLAVGGSWMARAEMIAAEDWGWITNLAREAARGREHDEEDS